MPYLGLGFRGREQELERAYREIMQLYPVGSRWLIDSGLKLGPVRVTGHTKHYEFGALVSVRTLEQPQLDYDLIPGQLSHRMMGGL